MLRHQSVAILVNHPHFRFPRVNGDFLGGFLGADYLDDTLVPQERERIIGVPPIVVLCLGEVLGSELLVSEQVYQPLVGLDGALEVSQVSIASFQSFFLLFY